MKRGKKIIQSKQRTDVLKIDVIEGSCDAER